MEVLSVSDVMQLFTLGLIAGAGLGSIAWLIGYAISALYAWIRKS